MEWIEVTDARRLAKLKKERWNRLQKRCPHIITPKHATNLAHRLNIRGLKEKLLSEEWIKHQTKGWKYVKTLRGGADATPQQPSTTEKYEYSIKEIGNKWNDAVLFSMELNLDRIR